MKFEMIAAADVDIIREARKVLKRFQKRLGKLDKKRMDAFYNTGKDCISPTADFERFDDELKALHICVKLGGGMSLEA